MLPPLHYQGMDAAQPFGYQPPAPGMHPSRMAALAAANGALQQAGTVRSADEMEGTNPVDDMPPAKRQRVAKIPGSQMYSEPDWVAMHPVGFIFANVFFFLFFLDSFFGMWSANGLFQHPISLQVQMPSDPSTPEWKLDGNIVSIPDLPLNLLVSTLRDRILQVTGSSVPASRIRLSYAGKMLTNKSSIAAYNLEDEDMLVFSLSAAKKK